MNELYFLIVFFSIIWLSISVKNSYHAFCNKNVDIKNNNNLINSFDTIFKGDKETLEDMYKLSCNLSILFLMIKLFIVFWAMYFCAENKILLSSLVIGMQLDIIFSTYYKMRDNKIYRLILENYTMKSNNFWIDYFETVNKRDKTSYKYLFYYLDTWLATFSAFVLIVK